MDTNGDLELCPIPGDLELCPTFTEDAGICLRIMDREFFFLSDI